jgi:hypothetical protein
LLRCGAFFRSIRVSISLRGGYHRFGTLGCLLRLRVARCTAPTVDASPAGSLGSLVSCAAVIK